MCALTLWLCVLPGGGAHAASARGLWCVDVCSLTVVLAGVCSNACLHPLAILLVLSFVTAQGVVHTAAPLFCVPFYITLCARAGIMACMQCRASCILTRSGSVFVLRVGCWNAGCCLFVVGCLLSATAEEKVGGSAVCLQKRGHCAPTQQVVRQ